MKQGMLRVSDDHRRARLARRHGLAAGHRHRTIAAATDAMTALHATEGTTVHLALHARMTGLTIEDVDRALYRERSIVKQMCMRRTIFAVTQALLPAVVASAGRRVGAEQVRGLRRATGHLDESLGPDWVDRARAEIVQTLTERPRTARDLRTALPHLAGTFRAGSGKWAADVPIVQRLLVLMSADGEVVRGENAGHWRISRPTWAAMTDWLGGPIPTLDPPAGYLVLVRHWLWTFGPGTEEDLVWWLGSTRTAARQALARIGAVPVALDDGGTGWVLPQDTVDLQEPAQPEPWVALLPTLDPTTMGWKRRDWYLRRDHAGLLFDSAGNAGTTIWADGRIVGGWVQDADHRVQPVLLDSIGPHAQRLLDREVARLDGFLRGQRITNVYTSPLVRRFLGFGPDTGTPVPSRTGVPSVPGDHPVPPT